MTVVRGIEHARRQHLLSCPHCDASNPVNATACWHCERDLRQPPAAAPEAPEATGTPDAASADTVPPADASLDAAPSFFPVLREEVDGRAAHNDSLWEPASAPPLFAGVLAPADDAPVPSRAALMRRLILAAVGGAVAASLVFVLVGRSGDVPVVPVANDAPPEAAAAAAVARPAPILPARTEPLPAEAGPQALVAPRAAATVKVAELPEVAGTAAARPVADVRAPARAARPARADGPVPARGADPVARRVAEPPALAPVKGPCTPNVAALGLCSIDTP